MQFFYCFWLFVLGFELCVLQSKTNASNFPKKSLVHLTSIILLKSQPKPFQQSIQLKYANSRKLKELVLGNFPFYFETTTLLELWIDIWTTCNKKLGNLCCIFVDFRSVTYGFYYLNWYWFFFWFCFWRCFFVYLQNFFNVPNRTHKLFLAKYLKNQLVLPCSLSPKNHCHIDKINRYPTFWQSRLRRNIK